VACRAAVRRPRRSIRRSSDCTDPRFSSVAAPDSASRGIGCRGDLSAPASKCQRRRPCHHRGPAGTQPGTVLKWERLPRFWRTWMRQPFRQLNVHVPVAFWRGTKTLRASAISLQRAELRAPTFKHLKCYMLLCCYVLLCLGAESGLIPACLS
jgi:hypothetical protein